VVVAEMCFWFFGFQAASFTVANYGMILIFSLAI